MKTERIAQLLKPFAGTGFDAHYLAFVDCFNRGRYFEAHEVLEPAWLPQRGSRKGLFFKGLIQLSGAFVHLRKNRSGPAAALLRLAQSNLRSFLPEFERLDVAAVLAQIDHWLQRLTAGEAPASQEAPRLVILG